MHGFVLELGRMLSLVGTAASETQERLSGGDRPSWIERATEIQ